MLESRSKNNDFGRLAEHVVGRDHAGIQLQALDYGRAKPAEEGIRRLPWYVLQPVVNEAGVLDEMVYHCGAECRRDGVAQFQVPPSVYKNILSVRG